MTETATLPCPTAFSLDATIAQVEEALGRAQRGESHLSPAALGIPGMTSEFNRHLHNNLCVQGADYLEIGTLMGASVIAAAFGNAGRFWAVDDFSQWPTLDGDAFLHLRQDPAYSPVAGLPTREAWQQHVASMGLERRITLVEQDCFAFEPDFTVDVFYYDGDHSAEATEQSLRRFVPRLRPAVLLIDDWRGPTVRLGVQRAQLPIVQAWEIEPAWNGLLVAVLEPDDVAQV